MTASCLRSRYLHPPTGPASSSLSGDYLFTTTSRPLHPVHICRINITKRRAYIFGFSDELVRRQPSKIDVQKYAGKARAHVSTSAVRRAVLSRELAKAGGCNCLHCMKHSSLDTQVLKLSIRSLEADKPRRVTLHKPKHANRQGNRDQSS